MRHYDGPLTNEEFVKCIQGNKLSVVLAMPLEIIVNTSGLDGFRQALCAWLMDWPLRDVACNVVGHLPPRYGELSFGGSALLAVEATVWDEGHECLEVHATQSFPGRQVIYGPFVVAGNAAAVKADGLPDDDEQRIRELVRKAGAEPGPCQLVVRSGKRKVATVATAV